MGTEHAFGSNLNDCFGSAALMDVELSMRLVTIRFKVF